MEKNPFISNVREKAKTRFATVAFPDAEDKRTLEASIFLLNEKIANPVLVGNKEKIDKAAGNFGLNISNIEIFDPAASEFIPKFANMLFEKRKNKGMTEQKATETVLDPLYFAGYLLETDVVDVVVGGNVSSTGAVIKAAIYTVGLQPGISLVSSFFIMTFPVKILC